MRARPAAVPAALAAAALVISGCMAEESDEGESGSPDTGQDAGHGAEGTEAPSGEEAEGSSFTILSTGDVLPHDAILHAAELPDGGWDFLPLLEGVQEWVSGADLALCSMEVPLAAPGEDPIGYPLFGAPEELVEGLRETGFHGCNTANNHSMDSGVDGLENTIETFEEHGMGHVGTSRSEQEAGQPQLYSLERGGREVTVAHLSTTLLHNPDHLPPEDEPWRVTDVDPEELTEMAAEAREDGADLVVASVHWGDEYVHEPVQEQTDYAEALADGGEVDLVYGNHSHTPQPLEELEGGPDDQGMHVVWSMGNFFSNQDEECCVMETATGLMVLAQVDVPQEGPVRVSGLEWVPVTNDREGESREDEEFRGIWALTELLEKGIPDGVGLEEETLQQRYDRVAEVMGEESLRSEPAEPTGEEPEALPRG